MKLDKENLGRLLLRIGLGFVLILFGIGHLKNPELWVGWIPLWITKLKIITDINFIYFLGSTQIIISLLILTGYYTRLAGVAASFLLLGILSAVGFNDIMIRDLGLLFMALSLIALGAGKWSLDKKIRGKH